MRTLEKAHTFWQFCKNFTGSCFMAHHASANFMRPDNQRCALNRLTRFVVAKDSGRSQNIFCVIENPPVSLKLAFAVIQVPVVELDGPPDHSFQGMDALQHLPNRDFSLPKAQALPGRIKPSCIADVQLHQAA
jgi:hypothetical protein